MRLSNDELARVTAGTIQIGDTNTGSITVSAPITRAAKSSLALITGQDNSLTFSGAGSLDVSGGDVMVLLNGAGTGGVVSGDATTDITSGRLFIGAGSGGIGIGGNPLTFNVDLLVTHTNDAPQFLSETNSLTISATTAAMGLDAGTKTITLNGGTFLTSAVGSIPSPVTVGKGATLGGTGKTGPVTVQDGGTVAPGNSPGILNTGSVTFASGSTFRVELNGTLVGQQYDQLNVTGSVVIDSTAILDASVGFNPATGVAFVIINNDGTDAVTGTFSGTSSGTLTINGKLFRIVYNYDAGTNTSGTGNDVALIAFGASPVANAGGSYVINAGSGVTLDASKTTDTDSTGLTYRWDINGDGLYSENITGVMPQLTAAVLAALGLGTGPQVVPVTVEVSDGFNTSTASTFLAVVQQSSDFNLVIQEFVSILTDAIASADGGYRNPEIIQLMTSLVTVAVASVGGNLRDPRIVELIAALSRAVSDSLPAGSRSIVIVADPVDLLLTDPEGRSTGFINGDPRSGNNIPGAYYSGNGAVELLVVPQAIEGTYSLLMAGLGEPYNLAYTVTNGGEVSTTPYSGTLAEGSNLQVSINLGALTVPKGLGLSGQAFANNSAFGVVGANDRLARSDAAARAIEQLQSDLEPNINDSDLSPIDRLVGWIRSAKATREQLVRQLFESLELPLGNLLEADADSKTKLPDELIDLFWKRLGQTLTGVPAGAYRIGDMLESLLPQNTKRSPNKPSAESGKTTSGTSTKPAPKIKRAPEARPRSSTKPIEKPQSNAQPLRSLHGSQDTATAQHASPFDALWHWFASDTRPS